MVMFLEISHASIWEILSPLIYDVHKVYFQLNFCMAGKCRKFEILLAHAQSEGVRLKNSAPPGASGWAPEAPCDS